MPDTPANVPRYDFLDWLRVLAIFVLFFFHTGMIFVGWGWHVVNAQTMPELQWPMDIAHRLRMPLLFVIAGAGMWYALRRRSARFLLRERTQKLLLPLVIGMFLVVPPQIYAERLLRGQWHGGYASFYLSRVLQFRLYPDGDFGWHHLWFIAYLFVYVLLLLPALVGWKRHGVRLTPGAWLFFLGIPLGINETLLKARFPETHGLVGDWYIVIHYLLLTAYGYLIASMPEAWAWFARVRRVALAGGTILLIALIVMLDNGTIPHDSIADHMGANLFTWLGIMVFVGYGYRYLSFTHPLLTWARDASYPIYILHQTVIVLIGYAVIQHAWTPWTKYTVILVASLATCAVVYQFGIRKVPLLRLAFGMKVRAKGTPGTWPERASVGDAPGSLAQSGEGRTKA